MRNSGLKSIMLDHGDHANNAAPGTANETYTFASTIQKTESKTVTSQITNTFGLKIGISIEGKFLDIVQTTASTELSYGYENMQATASTTTQQVTLTWTVGVQVAPGQHIYCVATAREGEANLGYTAQVNVMLKDGSTWSFTEKGTYNQVVWAQAQSSCQDKPFPGTKRAVGFIA